MKPCRECQHQISEQARACPSCGAPFPAKEKWDGWGFEYKSGAKLLGLPLLHISFKYRPNRLPVPAKLLQLQGQFSVKAGFGLDESLALSISADGSIVTLRHSPPRIISCELQKLVLARDQEGWWNKLTSRDREEAHAALLGSARHAAEESDLLVEAVAMLEARLIPVQQKHSFRFERDLLSTRI